MSSSSQHPPKDILGVSLGAPAHSTYSGSNSIVFGFQPMFVVLLGNGIDYWSSGANYGRYDTHHLTSQDDIC